MYSISEEPVLKISHCRHRLN